ncbi:MAG: ATP-binding protein, partial [Syntrophobacteraceae bacterium]
PHPKPLELPATVNAVIASLSGLIESRGIRVERKYSEAIAPLKADGELLELALRNILINALEAMPSGGTLTISICSQPGGLLLSIKDTGTGIRSEDLPNIFDPFFTSKTQGSGLGLTAVHRVIYDHSGDIVVDSAPGEGTEVRIRLPNR